jgi:hypothetical protein
MKPLLLLDVDGPLNPWQANPNRRPEGYTTHRLRPEGWKNPRKRPLRVWLKPTHGADLMSLPFDLVWCTTWIHEANQMIGPVLGLPELPVVTFDPEWHLPTRGDGTYFKTHDVVTWAEGRPFAWVDDEITDFDREYVAAHHQGPALLHHVSPRLGLLEPDFKALAAWAAGL